MAMKDKVKLQLVGENPKNVSGESNKFWTGWTHGTNFLAHWGAIGTDGQIRSWSFKSEYEAEAKLDEKVYEKRRKGYERVC
jgi:predicted DNA-binding WGR domain protein